MRVKDHWEILSQHFMPMLSEILFIFIFSINIFETICIKTQFSDLESEFLLTLETIFHFNIFIDSFGLKLSGWNV